MIKRNKCFLKILCFSFLLLGINSCQLFENDAADFFEKYTETAAIETHNISVPAYNDALSQLCIASEEDAEIEMYMRNPKKYNLVPSVTFDSLDEQISRASVDISQTDINTIKLLLPQNFLIASDEGKNITADISLYEPMSGRSFDRYKISLFCNTKPPAILNPTVINNANSTFVVAFDMPSPEEVAVRHKDISAVEINGQSYPVTVTTRADPDIEGAYLAEYTIEDSHFTRTASSAYTFIGGKDFTAKAATSFFYETGDTFYAGDKEYTVVLKDSAGLTSTVKASTSISKLNKPVLRDQSGTLISENGMTGIPFDEDTMQGKITIEPPSQDHLGNAVTGAVVHYKVYEATGSGLIYTSGTTTEIKTIELPQNTYRVEAYATLTNYENSSTTTVKFRFINNILYVKAGFENGDGSEGAPYATIAEAIADINARPRHETMFAIYAEDNGAVKLNEEIVLSGDFNTDLFTIAKKPGAESATLKSLKLESDLPSAFSFTGSGLTVSGSTAEGISLNADVPVTLSDITVKDSSSDGIKIESDSVITLKNVNISNAGTVGLKIIKGTVTANALSVISSTNDGIRISGGSLEYTGGTISSNGGNGITVNNGTIAFTYNDGTISGNSSYGLTLSGSGSFVYNNGTISGNTEGGIFLYYVYGFTYNNGIIEDNNDYGINGEASNIIYKNGTIRNHVTGITGDGVGLDLYGGTITQSATGIALTGGRLSVYDGSISSNSRGVYLGSGTNHSISGGSIINNTEEGISVNNAAITITGGTISGNQAGGVIFSGAASAINMSGNPVIKNNTKLYAGNTIIRNLDLAVSGSTVPVAITGPLTTGCDVGITTAPADEPSIIGNKFSFTTGYGTYNTASPAAYFKSDRGFAIISEGSGSSQQAAIALAGANGNADYNAFDYHCDFGDYSQAIIIKKGRSKQIMISPIFYRDEPSPYPQTSFYLDTSDCKLYDLDDDSMDSSCAGGASVTVKVELYCGEVFISDLTNNLTPGDRAYYLNIPAIENPDRYTLRAHALFLGRDFDASIPVDVMDILGEKLRPTDIGDIVFSDGSCISYSNNLVLDDEQKAGAVAVIFQNTGGKILGVGLEQRQIKLLSNNSLPGYEKVTGTSSSDGSVNMNVFITLASDSYSEENYPALWWADHYGVEYKGVASGWYIPASSEMQTLREKRFSVNNSIKLIEGNNSVNLFPDDNKAHSYMTSTQHYNYTYCVDAFGWLSSGSSSSGSAGKKDANLVRVIRDFTPAP